jgi:hypothetical protein
MESVNKLLEQIDQLIAKGERVLASSQPIPNLIGFLTLDSSASSEWDSQSMSFLTRVLGQEHIYFHNFQSKGDPSSPDAVEAGLGILKALREDLVQGYLGQPKSMDSALLVEQVCNRFHLVARQLSSRYENRQTLIIQDEYDVQDLLHAILWLHFDDIREEEHTPSYAGKSSRMDFLLKRESIVLEAKKTRQGLGAKEVSTQLIEDIDRYKSHPDCKALFCFVYDPEGFIPNPRGLEDDLKRDSPYQVRVLIRPI